MSFSNASADGPLPSIPRLLDLFQTALIGYNKAREQAVNKGARRGKAASDVDKVIQDNDPGRINTDQRHQRRKVQTASVG